MAKHNEEIVRLSVDDNMVLKDGTTNVAVEEGDELTIKSDCNFYCYGWSKKECVRIFGPTSSSVTYLYIKVPPGVDRIEIKTTEPGSKVQIEYILRVSHYDPTDPVPMAIPEGMEKPLTMEEMVAKYVAKAVYAIESAKEDFDSPEESEDFGEEDYEDDDHLFGSRYEIPDMEYEEPIERAQEPPEEKPKENSAEPVEFEKLNQTEDEKVQEEK